MRLCFLFFALLSSLPLLAQEKSILKIKVVDCNDGKPLPFANVYSSITKLGTATNFEGSFTFLNNSDDTLNISFIGYQNLKVPINSLYGKKEVCLSPKSFPLDLIEISEESDFLYRLIQACKKNKATKERQAKSYFFLKSKVNDQQVELIESYYNGHFKDYDLTKLDLKISRIYLAPFQESYFVSLGTSLGINMHQTFESNLDFPLSPLEVTFSKSKKEFDLQFVEKYREDTHTVYVIDFEHKKGSPDYFKGRIWLDSTNSQLLKVNLKNSSGKRSPFDPIGEAQKVTFVSFDITKSYKTIDNEQAINSIYFNFEIGYERRNDTDIVVETEAALFAYDYENKFLLPFFPISYNLNDYQSAVMAPYNDFFWNNNKDFQFEALEEDKDLFLNDNNTNSIKTFSYNNNTKEVSFKKTSYKNWNSRRIDLSDFEYKPNVEKNKTLTIYEKYKLDINIYMDINTKEDSIDVQLLSVFDPYSSYILLDEIPQTKAFINMYFDLVEIQKRKLEGEIKNMTDTKSIIKAYQINMDELEEISKSYFNDVLGGSKHKKLVSWNDYIFYNLNIDNLKYFKLDPKTGKSPLK